MIICTGGLCSSLMFMCKNGEQCIHREFMCDGDQDCRDGSDELECGSKLKRMNYSISHLHTNWRICPSLKRAKKQSHLIEI